MGVSLYANPTNFGLATQYGVKELGVVTGVKLKNKSGQRTTRRSPAIFMRYAYRNRLSLVHNNFL